MDGDCGGGYRRAWGEKQREGENKLEREREQRWGDLILLQAVGGGTHPGGRSGDRRDATELIHCSTKKTTPFCKNPPRLWGFSGNIKTQQFLIDLLIQLCLKKNMKLAKDFPINC
jgi:hypothetical protein